MSQDIITVNGDTLITITPSQLSTINCAFSDLKLRERQVIKQKEVIEGLEERICYDDSIFTHMEEVMSIRNDRFAAELEQVRVEAKKEQKKKSIMWVIIGVFTGLFIGIATR